MTPTHRATVPRDRVQGLQLAPTGRNASGGGGQAITNQPIPVKPNELKPLDRNLWDRVVDFIYEMRIQERIRVRLECPDEPDLSGLI